MIAPPYCLDDMLQHVWTALLTYGLVSLLVLLLGGVIGGYLSHRAWMRAWLRREK